MKKYALKTPEDHIRIHENVLESEKPFLLGVFADWCGHCVRLTHPQGDQKKSEWDAFLGELSAKIPDANVLQLDYDGFEEFKGQNAKCEVVRILNHVTSFPHVSVVQKDKKLNKINVHVYDGAYPMNKESLLSFIFALSPPPPKS